MTLIITAATRQNIYQSADFRLTDARTGRVLTDQSTKLVTVTYADWHGFIAYTGLGNWDGRDTSEWITDWLRRVRADTPEVVETLLIGNGTTWLGEVSRRLRRTTRHTFVFAAFDASGSRISVISNFENLGGRNDVTAAPELTSSTVRPRHRPAVVICGAKGAVNKADRKALLRLLRVPSVDTARMRRELAAMNQRGAAAPASRGAVSADCSVVWARADGRGAMDVGACVEIRSVVNGMVMPNRSDLSAMLGCELGKPRGMTMASSRSKRSFPECHPVVIGDQNRYAMVELTHRDLSRLEAMAINPSGAVAGVGRVRNAMHDVPWRRDRDGALLVANIRGRALAIDVKGVVGGCVIAATGGEVAMVWDGSGAQRLRGAAGPNSRITAMSSSGLAAGWVGIDPAEQGQLAQRPAAWLDAGHPVVLDDLGGAWGSCVDITDDGVALVIVYRNHRPSALLWHLRTGELLEVGGGGRVYPTALNRSGLVLGNSGDRCMIAESSQPWRDVFGLPGYHGTAINERGTIVGYCTDGGYGKPWLRTSDGELVRLPYLKDHWTKPTALNDDGWIVGTATSDHGSHAVLWLPIPGSHEGAMVCQ